MVSKAMRDRAQPLLWHKIVTQSGEDLGRMERLLKSGSVSDLVTQAWVLFAEGLVLQKVRAVAGLFPRLTRVELGAVSLIFSDDLAELCNSSRIESLALSNTVIRAFPTAHGPCRTITSLSLSSITYFAVSVASEFLSIEMFPSLRALAIGSPFTSIARRNSFYPIPIPTLLQQLDSVQITLDRNTPIPSSLLLTDTPVLFTISSTLDSSTLAYILHTPLKRIRIVPYVIEVASDFATAIPSLANLLTLLNTSSSNPLSIHLPYFWRAVDSALQLEVSSLVSEVQDACRRDSVEVVWCGEGQETEQAVSEEFWEYGRSIKAEREGAQSGRKSTRRITRM